MKRRWTGAVPFQPSITQKVKQALYDSGHEDLVDGILDSGLKEIEQTVDDLQKRVVMLEAGHRERVTATGVNKLIEARVNRTTTKMAFKALPYLGGLALTAAGAVLSHIIWKTP